MSSPTDRPVWFDDTGQGNTSLPRVNSPSTPNSSLNYTNTTANTNISTQTWRTWQPYVQSTFQQTMLNGDTYAWDGEEPEPPEEQMIQKLIKLYYAYMQQDVRSPIPHLAGPPGTGKSSDVEALADMLGVNLHIVNVSRISPLELEGVQMPVDNNTRLELLLATLWSKLNEGDIVLLDEFLRGFPEVYNGLLDIITSRTVAGHKLPKVFFVAASNSVAAYDKALEDRLLHLFVPDLRNPGQKAEKKRVATMMCEQIGLMPQMAEAYEMDEVFDKVVLKTYKMLDAFNRKASLATTAIEGYSVRHIVGQCLLREVTIPEVKALIYENNRMALAEDKHQYVFLIDGCAVHERYPNQARKLLENPRLTDKQRTNIEINLQLIDMAAAEKE